MLFERDDDTAANPATAAPIPDDTPTDRAAVMQQVAAFAARPAGRVAKWFWSALVALVGFIASLAAWDYVNGLLARSPVLGGIATALFALFVGALLVVLIRELAAMARLGRIDGVQRAAAAALAGDDLSAAQQVVAQLEGLYARRSDLNWGLQRVRERAPEVLDASGLLALAEAELVAPLDAAAEAEVQAAARTVATVTAVVPIALADLISALTANVRMIRRIAEIYGGRAGAFGAWRLLRTVMTHLVATGAVAVGDDMIDSVVGGGVMSKVSRRFGEGVINGALTARVGVAAIEVCRPVPFINRTRPSVRGLLRGALVGLFNRG
ncbi:ycjF [Ketogulonicigenium robustum]|uniref:YcjF n=2 Tax=Ketogulonicigenium robustum TaxID=92947 RepID=A0A1W6NZY9_9RHOB|nr:ycjF [Ketogulonicigenium robustum]